MVAYVHRRQCELVTLKPVLYYCIFDRMVLKTATGTDVANISFYAEGSLFFFFFKKYGLLCILHRGHWSCMDWKKLMQNEKETNKTKQKKKPAFPKLPKERKLFLQVSLSVSWDPSSPMLTYLLMNSRVGQETSPLTEPETLGSKLHKFPL